MRALPLAAALLCALVSAAAALPCAVPLKAAPGRPAQPFESSSPACLAVKTLTRDFARIRVTAGFTADQLELSVKPDTSTVNAFYVPGGVQMTLAFVNKTDITHEGRLMVIAHEIGHAVQDREGTIAWKNEPVVEFNGTRERGIPWLKSPEHLVYLERSRKVEAHADAIGQELLQRAGYSTDLFGKGSASFFGCRTLADFERSPRTHPVDAQRYLNTAMTNGALAAERARKAASGRFASSPMPAPFVPAAKITDYAADGGVRPGRRAAAVLAVPPPPPDAGPLRRGVNAAAAKFVRENIAVPFGRAVDGLSERNHVAASVLKACGTEEASGFDEDFGVLGWTSRLAADAVLRLVGARKTAP